MFGVSSVLRVVWLALAMSTLVALPMGAQEPLPEMALGDPGAPVTVVEYASFTCPHCASFHIGTFAKLKADYIDTGKVRFIYRDFPLDKASFQASILARCAGSQRFFAFIEVLYSQQQSWSRHADPLVALQTLAGLGGVSPAKYDACLKDRELGDGILSMRVEGEQRYGVISTPSFLVNGVKHVGAITPSGFDVILKPLLESTGKPRSGTRPSDGRSKS